MYSNKNISLNIFSNLNKRINKYIKYLTHLYSFSSPLSKLNGSRSFKRQDKGVLWYFKYERVNT